jgi:hypothetical protein
MRPNPLQETEREMRKTRLVAPDDQTHVIVIATTYMAKRTELKTADYLPSTGGGTNFKSAPQDQLRRNLTR